MKINRGDEIVTVKSLYHNGTDIGDRLAVVLDTTSYILVQIYDYTDNPVKLHRHEIDRVAEIFHDLDTDDLENIFQGLFNPDP